MSYVGPDFDPPEPRRSRRRPLTFTVAALVPTALVGWLVYTAVADTGGGPADAAPATASSASPSTPHPSASPSATASPTAHGEPSKASSTPTSRAAASGSLKGKVVVIDPGHNPDNFRHTTEINRKVNIGTNSKECDTTGAATNAGYPEAEFTLAVARRLRPLLQQQGITVKFTQDGDRPWGPCVTERARIGNEAHADAAISLHADGSAPGNRGFHVILPAAVHAGGADTRPIAARSRDLGERVAGNFLRVTGSAPSNYLGNGTGLVVRNDLGGLNLSTVPKVFIECGNMRDSKDAALLTSEDWQQKAARGISEGIVSFLRGK
ncbi:N-acetylmuramoyl-L-alanine amidase [Streptomyces sp. NPDC052051]|uniref:N-acetylmuramoyl-L-alanine amidase n=1 Tax=Streptomyces sp. NPDC052051 TaxID=3154649 RepID=UPI00341B5692